MKSTGNVIMNVLVTDIGGTHVKVLATGPEDHREFNSGPALTPTPTHFEEDFAYGKRTEIEHDDRHQTTY